MKNKINLGCKIIVLIEKRITTYQRNLKKNFKSKCRLKLKNFSNYRNSN